ncbi:uncharacterized protein LODBEIA_P54100 [Lodderomyces beijingensis]|uniref:RRM domain-containing protein n=1 Tax=Lodderomyces beijingensis TaxID=1775926 RepID=A0ABP0ZSS3_9ASCO
MSSVIASDIPSQTTPAEVRKFFSFAGKITNLIPLGDDGKVKKYEVVFASPKAVSTALLLNDAELNNGFIRVDEIKEITDGETGKAPQDDGPGYDGDAQKTGDAKYDAVDQENKPKYGVFAQLLAEGYILKDEVVKQATEFDKQYGISEGWDKFIDDVAKVQQEGKRLAGLKQSGKAA